MLPNDMVGQSGSFTRIFLSYDYELKINDDKDGAEYLAGLIDIDKSFLVNEDGFLGDAVLEEFSWRLSDLSIFSDTISFSKRDLQNIPVYEFFGY